MQVAGRVSMTAHDQVVLEDDCASLTVSLGHPCSATPGDWLVLRGRLAGGHIGQAQVVHHCPAPEPRGDGEHARLLWSGVGRRLRGRSAARREVRAFFDAAGFQEVETPLRVSGPQLDAHLAPVAAEDGWLIASPEYHMKRLLVGGMSRIFQLARCSRADERGQWHEPEFTMLEWYRAFADAPAVMADTEEIVRRVAACLCAGRPIESPSGAELDLGGPFERLSIAEAYSRFAGVSDAVELARVDEERYFRLWVERVEPALARYRLPVFINDYPITQAALARPSPANPQVAERFELFIGGIELCNGYGELTEARENQRRLTAVRDAQRAQGYDSDIDQAFVAALEEGLPPCAGNALGFDRLVALCLGAGSLAEVIAFPSHRR